MRPFAFVRPRSAEEAAAALVQGGVLKAGGADLLDRMKEGVDEPTRVVGLVDVPGLSAIEVRPDGSARIGALATLADLARSPALATSFPSLVHAAREAASPQIRHRATLGGNLAQHTRCGYYRHRSFPCLKRGAEACPVLADGAVQETAAVFGNSTCASAHPSSLAPVLGTLDATVVVRGSGGERRIAFADLWDVPRRGKASDVTLAPGDVVVAVDLPAGIRDAVEHVAFEEVRSKASFDWALVSCAVRFLGGEMAPKDARIWLGAVAPTPWRARKAETVLEQSGAFSEAAAAKAAEAAADGATPLAGNGYKVALVKVCVRRALTRAWERRG